MRFYLFREISVFPSCQRLFKSSLYLLGRTRPRIGPFFAGEVIGFVVLLRQEEGSLVVIEHGRASMARGTATEEERGLNLQRETAFEASVEARIAEI